MTSIWIIFLRESLEMLEFLEKLEGMMIEKYIYFASKLPRNSRTIISVIAANQHTYFHNLFRYNHTGIIEHVFGK